MKILAIIITLYAPVMLLIHVSTGKILRAWNEQPESRISRWFTPRRALRVEGAFWLLALAAWPLWRPLVLKVLVVIFASIHLGIWGASEFTTGRQKGPAFTTSPTAKRIIVIFDSLEAFVLAVLEVVAVLYLVP
jgi:hypothetical protein